MTFSLPLTPFLSVWHRLRSRALAVVVTVLCAVSVLAFVNYLQNGLGLAYNDARSHLDIGRRVVESLKPGLAQLGSVWLPLPHLLMVPTIWIDFMWHSGLAGALQSMISYVVVGVIIWKFLEKLNVGLFGRSLAVLVFAANPNILYLQSTAMTEILLLATMTAGCYFLLLWLQADELLDLVTAGFFIMLSTLIRYDGWFLLAASAFLVFAVTLRRHGYQAAEGKSVLFATLAGLGIALWFLWNLLIFKDPLYFVFGPFSAYAQQSQLAADNVLHTKGNIVYSVWTYLSALVYNSTALITLLGLGGLILILLHRGQSVSNKLGTLPLLAPLAFNIIALYLGHSVLYVPELSGNTWFNIRYGVMLVPSLAIFIGYLAHHAGSFRPLLAGLLLFAVSLSLVGQDAVTIDDALYGSSQKNVTQVAGLLNRQAKDLPGFILVSAASHDAVIFSSGLPMSRFIHEGTGAYWESAVAAPDRWARWIVMRTHDQNDWTFREVSKTSALEKYDLVAHYEFADVYELKPEYLPLLNVKPVFTRQK